MMMGNFIWSTKNEKLKKTSDALSRIHKRKIKIVSFNIPRLISDSGKKTCPYAGYCAEICYADQGRFKFTNSISVREKNLELIMNSLDRNFVDLICEDIGSMKSVTHVRIHDSGDFFSRKYYNRWVDVSKVMYNIIFYAYTKSIPFINYEKLPENFRLVQSVGGKMDNLIDTNYPHSRIFSSNYERKKNGYCDGNKTDIPAIRGSIKIGLVYHGNRSLTEDQRLRLKVIDHEPKNI